MKNSIFIVIIFLININAYSQYLGGNADGFSTNVSSVVIQPLTIPALIIPMNNSTGIIITPNFTWNSVMYATSYSLQISTDSIFSSIILNQNGIIDTSYFINILQYNNQYFWRVQAINDIVTSPWSNIWNFTTMCDPNQTYSISGIVSYNNTQETPLSNCTVNLIDSTGYLILQTYTDNNGYYNFSYVFPGIYKIEVSTTKIRGGLNILDAVLTRRYIAFLTQFTQLQKKAADVNMNNSINILDVVYMRQKIAFLNPPQWIIQDYVFEVPAVNLCGNDAIVNIKALCAGDVNGSYVPPQ